MSILHNVVMIERIIQYIKMTMTRHSQGQCPANPTGQTIQYLLLTFEPLRLTP